MERAKRQLQVELDEVANNQGTADKNVHELERAKRSLESQLVELKAQNEELEDELQLTEDAKLRLDVNMQALRTQFERDLAVFLFTLFFFTFTCPYLDIKCIIEYRLKKNNQKKSVVA